MVAAASTQSSRYAAMGGTPVPKNSVLIVGATGTLGVRALALLCTLQLLEPVGCRDCTAGLTRRLHRAGRQIVRLSLDEGYEVRRCGSSQHTTLLALQMRAAHQRALGGRCAASCARGRTRRTFCGTGAPRPYRPTSTTQPRCRPPWCAAGPFSAGSNPRRARLNAAPSSRGVAGHTPCQVGARRTVRQAPLPPETGACAEGRYQVQHGAPHGRRARARWASTR